MAMRIEILKTVSFCVLLHFCFVASAYSQAKDSGHDSLEEVCAAIESKIIESLPDSSAKRKVVYEDSCEHYIVTGDDRVMVDFYRYDSSETGKREYEFSVRLLTSGPDFDPKFTKRLELYDTWSNAEGYFNPDDRDHLVALRVNRYFFILIGSNYQQLISVEKSLRSVPKKLK